LLVSGHAMREEKRETGDEGRGPRSEEMVQAALDSLEWLAVVQKSRRGHFLPVGSNGFYVRGGERARFDQQPIEAQVSVSACLAAQAITQDGKWGEYAHLAFDWFLGWNDLG